MKKVSWKKIDSRVAYKNRWITLREDTICLPNGDRDVYDYIDSPLGVMAVALDEDNRMLLVRHYRYPTQRYGWEFPGGGADGQSALRAAKRELLEETGYVARAWKKIGTQNSWAFRTNEKIAIYLAQELSLHGDPTDDSEPISGKKWFTVEEISECIESGTICDAQIITAFFYACKHLGRI